MQTLLEQIEPVDYLIRQLHKIDSKLQVGQFIAAHREVCRLIAMFENHRKELIKDDPNARGETDGTNEADGTDDGDKERTDREVDESTS